MYRIYTYEYETDTVIWFWWEKTFKDANTIKRMIDLACPFVPEDHDFHVIGPEFIPVQH